MGRPRKIPETLQKKYFSTADALLYLELSAETVKLAVRDGRLKPRRVGNQNVYTLAQLRDFQRGYPALEEPDALYSTEQAAAMLGGMAVQGLVQHYNAGHAPAHLIGRVLVWDEAAIAATREYLAEYGYATTRKRMGRPPGSKNSTPVKRRRKRRKAAKKRTVTPVIPKIKPVPGEPLWLTMLKASVKK